MTDDDKQALGESTPWYRRSMLGKIVTGALVTAAGALTVWLASVIFSAATIEPAVQANTDDISEVEKTLEEDVVPKVERIDERTEQTQQSIERLETMRLEQAQSP